MGDMHNAATAAAAAAAAAAVPKVHGSPEAANAARAHPRWSQLLSIVWDTSKRPLLWFFTLVSLMHGEAACYCEGGVGGEVAWGA
jgi:hypothetical protein